MSSKIEQVQLSGVTVIPEDPKIKIEKEDRDISTVTVECFETDEALPSKRSRLSFHEQGGYTLIFTAEFCENEGGANARAGWAVYLGNGQMQNEFGPVQLKATMDAAKLQSCTRALKIAQDSGIFKIRFARNYYQFFGEIKPENKIAFQKLESLCDTLGVIWGEAVEEYDLDCQREAKRLAKKGAEQ